MRVLLVRPPHHNPRLASYANEPLGLETVASRLDGHEVELLDMQIDRRPFEGVLDRFGPDVVGTGGYTADLPQLRRVLERAKSRRAETFTVVGGHHATLAPEDFALPFVDAIVLGMGEVTFAELLAALEAGSDPAAVAGLALPEGDRLRRTEVRPFPAELGGPPPRRDLTAAHRHRYAFFGKQIGVINTARGCPFKCRFCAIVGEMRGRYITKSPERVLAELESMPQTYVRFADGNTFGNPKRMDRLCELIAAAGLRKRYVFDMRADTIARNPERIAAWRAVGLEYVAIGLEAIDGSRLTALDKSSTVDDNERAIEILHANQIRVIGQFMIDPDFDERDFDALARWVQDQEIQFPSFTILTPFVGTPLYDERRAELTTDDPTRFDCLHLVLPTRMERRAFLRRCVDLYDRFFSWRRVGRAALAFGRGRDLPLSLLLPIRAYLSYKRRDLEREYGLVD